ncbi:histidinol-phosphate transaminase [Prevotella sp. HUN102]|uniref:histidinol-phosphate transaminase n=1 Tax=Prevotella sp. HUN102 TaxID=1392486 RepID=UPI00048C66D3|nr:histidinol-phosphate transaminase [Prevotella sp. HUN102]
MRSLEELTRPNIWKLTPYSDARNQPEGRNAHVLLDADENPYNKPFNRYPDPLQTDLKAKIAKIKGVKAEEIFLGNGSDEAIDLCYRIFCEPTKDNVVAIEPTREMYKRCADLNNVEYRPVLLNERYDIESDKILAACDKNTKLIWLCSPNTPTGNNLNRDEIQKIVETFDGIVVADEAYSDFSKQKTFREELAKYPNIIVLNTFSKAWGCAAIRLGMAFARKEIIDLLNKVKQPYNINLLTQNQALEALQHPFDVEDWIKILLQERSKMMKALKELPICEEVYPSDANFFLIKVTDAQTIYDYLTAEGISVRNRTKVALCNNCLQITIGTKSENGELLGALRRYK